MSVGRRPTRVAALASQVSVIVVVVVVMVVVIVVASGVVVIGPGWEGGALGSWGGSHLEKRSKRVSGNN